MVAKTAWMGRRRGAVLPLIALVWLGWTALVAWLAAAVAAATLAATAWLAVAAGVFSGAAVAATAVIAAARRRDSEQRRSEAAELALAQARLATLRAQINPHFLFNSLNVIRSLVRTEPDTARALLVKLSRCFHWLLRQEELTPLADELEHLAAYVELEQTRFEDRLSVELPQPDPGLLDFPVPTLILQPLVENAIRHGIGPKLEGGTVTVTVAADGAGLRLVVRDDGVGVSQEPSTDTLRRLSWSGDLHHGIGLVNADARLHALYGDAGTLAVDSVPGRGTSVTVCIPGTAAGTTEETP